MMLPSYDPEFFGEDSPVKRGTRLSDTVASPKLIVPSADILLAVMLSFLP